MSYIDDNLLTGEQIIYRTSLHRMAFLPYFYLMIVVVFLSGLFLLYLSSNPSEIVNDEVPAFISFAALVIVIVLCIFAFISYKTSEFYITNKRVLAKSGFISRNSLEILLIKVESIQVIQSMFGKTHNYGTIIIRGTGGTSNPFHQIKSPLEFRKKAQEQIDLVQQKG